MVSVFNVLASGVSYHCRLVQPAIRMVLNSFQGRDGNGKMRVFDGPVQLVDLAVSPLCVYKKREPFLPDCGAQRSWNHPGDCLQERFHAAQVYRQRRSRQSIPAL